MSRYLEKSAVFTPHASLKLIEGTFAFRNLDIDMSKIIVKDKLQYLACNDGAKANFNGFYIEGCSFKNMQTPIFYANNLEHVVTDIKAIDNKFAIIGLSDKIGNNILYNLYKTTVLDAYKSFVFNSNILYLQSGKANLQILNYANATKQNGTAWTMQIDMRNNIIYDLPGRNVYLKTFKVGGANITKNVFYADPANTETPSIFCAYGEGQDGSLITIEDNITYGSNTNWNLYHANSTVKADPNIIPKVEENPFEVANTATGEFKLKADYSAYGPQAK